MSRARNPEYDKRDLKFAHSCEKCARMKQCAFPSSLEGPEAVCRQLIEYGTYNCESCLRWNHEGGCSFECVFFRVAAGRC